MMPASPPIFFASDVHLHPGAEVSNAPFLDFLQAVRKRPASLYLLGDVFDYWIGPKHLGVDDYRPILEAFRSLTRSGVEVSFLHGNRDYLVDRAFARATGIRVLGESAVLELDGRRVLLAHGDFSFNRNPKYAAYRRMMRLDAVRSAYLSAPAGLGRVLARGMRKVSQKTTAPVLWTREEVLAGAGAKFREGFDVFICGHIHLPQHHRLRLDGRDRDVYVLGDWDGGTRDYLEYDGAFRFLRWKKGTC